MNIIHVIAHYYPFIGGMELKTRDLIDKFPKKGNHIEVFTSDIACPKDKQLKSTSNLKIHYLPAKEFFLTPVIPSLYRELMNIPPLPDTIMHVHIAHAYLPEVVYRFWKKRKIPYIAHIHYDSNPSSLLGKIILRPYKQILLKRFLRHAKKIFVLTEDYKELAIKKYSIDKEKIIIIPNGNSFKIVPKSAKKIRGKVNKLLFVGSLTYGKNIPLLLESFKIAHEKNKELTLNIVGDGDERKYAEKFIKENNLSKVVFLKGRLEGKELEKAYRNADIFISPTRRESFGNVYLEAMSCSLPIITSNVPGVRNVVKNGYNGLLVNQDSSSFVKAIEKLIETPQLRERLVINGLQEIKKYSWDSVVAQTQRAYEEVLREENKK